VANSQSELHAYRDVQHEGSSWVRELGTWLRGAQTIKRARRAGLRSSGPVYLGTRAYIDEAFAWAVSIGAYTTIANDVHIIAHDAAPKLLTGYSEVRPVVIGSRCYIGAGAIVLPGARIGDGAVIGAGSVVRGEIPAGATAAGSPARVIGSVEEFCTRHKQLQATHQCFERRPSEGLTSREIADMREALDRQGRIYVR
jgi:carbonic anhydrase/acetyltransferase-like protein (isoleucine patch superfamily)